MDLTILDFLVITLWQYCESSYQTALYLNLRTYLTAKPILGRALSVFSLKLKQV